MTTTGNLIERLETGVYGINRIALCAEAAAHMRRLDDALMALNEALWKQCADDEQIVRDAVESQGGNYDAIKELIAP